MMKKRLVFPLTFVLWVWVLLMSGTAMAGDNPELRYISYDRNGGYQGERTCTDYQLITNSSASWYDINDADGGWYAAKGNVTLSSKTTLRVTGNVHLILCDGATLTVGDGVYIKKGSSLSIYGQFWGTGKLIAKPDSGPGIGGMADTIGGSLYVHGGEIEAKGGTNAAGIGGGNHDSGYENIVIYGGTVNATGGSSGAGIGKGQQNNPWDCGLIAIYGGEVTASSVKYGAGIGGGEDRDGGTIRIYGGTVNAKGGQDGAGIGGGESGDGGDILIKGGNVTAKGGAYAAGIGGGENGNSGAIEITGGTVRAYGAYGGDNETGKGAGIGGGKTGKISQYVTISGGDVYAEGGKGDGAGIGACERGQRGPDGKNQGGPVTISGGKVVAKASFESAGIGASGHNGHGGTVTITGGDVTAYGGSYSAGIGGSAMNDSSWEYHTGGDGGTVTITDGTVRAYGGNGGAGIGGSYQGNGGTVTIQGGTVEVHAGYEGAGIGGGSGGQGGSVSITGGEVSVYFDDSDGSLSQAIGGGHYNPVRAGGSLSIGEGMEAIDLYGNIPIPSVNRVMICESHVEVRIIPCANHDNEGAGAWEITEAGHTKACMYCGAPLPVTGHIFTEGVCTCGYTGTAVKVTYAAGHEGASGEMAPETYLPNTTYPLPDCRFTVSGYEFAGWQVGNTGEILPEGQEYAFDRETTLTATWSNAWTELQAAMDSAESGAVIALSGNTTASVYDGALMVPAEKRITLDLKGFILSRGLTKATAGGHVLTNNGNLTIMDSGADGTIMGGWTKTESSGGGIVNNGTLTINSGTIIGNRAGDGGGIYNAKGAVLTITGGMITGNHAATYSGGAVINRGTMNITGGTISGNASKMNGAGIWSVGTINLSGGTITGNVTGTGQNGGGIYCSAGTLNLSGGPVVSGNSVRNLYLKNGVTVRMAGAVHEGLQIGLYCESYPTGDDEVKVITTGIQGYTGGFVSDSEDRIAFVNGAGELVMMVKPAFGTPDFTLPGEIAAIEESAFEGAAMSVVCIPEGCESIGDHAFKDCLSLKQIRIPEGCGLGTDVFDGCGTVFVFGAAGSAAEAYCEAHGNCVFVVETDET